MKLKMYLKLHRIQIKRDGRMLHYLFGKLYMIRVAEVDARGHSLAVHRRSSQEVLFWKVGKMT